MNSSTEKNDAAEACERDGSNCEFQQNLDLLRQIPFFAGLPLEPIKVFAYLAGRENFKAGEKLFEQDDTDGQAFYVIKGTARLVRNDEEGKRELTEFGESSFLGGLALLGDMRRLFDLRAETDMVCLVLTRDKFMRALEQFPEIMPRIMESVVKSVREWEKRFFVDHATACATCGDKVGVSLV